nr:hypothetical protein [Tanacetum cinerariifolium]
MLGSVSSLSCLKLWISSSCFAVLDGGQYLRMKVCLRKSHVLIVPGGSLSTYLLAAPVSMIGNTRNMTVSCVTLGILKRLKMSVILLTCS